MKTVTNMIHLAFALFAIACFALSPTANADQPTPNHPKRRIDFKTLPLQCAPERVEVSGVLHLHFKKEGSVIVPERANFTEFSGTGKFTNRTYVPSRVHVERQRHARFENGVGAGDFILEFQLIGKPNPPGTPDPNPLKTFSITISYKVVYTFDNKVKGLNLGNPKGCCNPSGCL